jgi:serine acetyltransferase
MRTGGRTIRLSGSFNDKGAAGTDIIPVVGFFTPGSSATIGSGSIVKAFLDEDITVAQPPAPAPAKPSSK